jgi:hypothetical protein
MNGIISTQELVDNAGGIETYIAQYFDALSRKRWFPWYYEAFPLRAERREFRISRVRFPWIAEDEDDQELIESHSAEFARAHDQTDAIYARYARIVQADFDDKFDHLSHEEFCDTAYWLGLSLWMKIEFKMRCGDCNQRFPNSSDLDLHHKTYAHRGREYPDHLSDLVVLCRRCHSRRHGK